MVEQASVAEISKENWHSNWEIIEVYNHYQTDVFATLSLISFCCYSSVIFLYWQSIYVFDVSTDMLFSVLSIIMSKE